MFTQSARNSDGKIISAKIEDSDEKQQIPDATASKENVNIEMNKRKRTLHVNSIQTKYLAILEVEKRLKSKTAIAKDFNIPSNTLSTWIKHAEKIKFVYRQGCFQPGRKRMRFGDYEDVDNALYNWFVAQRDEHVALNGPMMIKKAKELADQLGYSEFKCSNGWFDRFKDRHGIQLRRTDDGIDNVLYSWLLTQRDQNEAVTEQIVLKKAKKLAEQYGYTGFKASNLWLDRFKNRHGLCLRKSGDCATYILDHLVDLQESYAWDSYVSELLADYDAENIFSTVEMTLLYRLLPSQLQNAKDAIIQGNVRSDERLSVLTCSNITETEKLPLLITGTPPRLECSENVRALPLQYESSKKSKITPAVFTKWLRHVDAQFKLENRKVAIIVKTCIAQCLGRGLEAIHLVLIPDTVCPPGADELIENLKTSYRSGLILQQNNAFDMEADFRVTLSVALEMLQSSWDNVNRSSIPGLCQSAVQVKEEKDGPCNIPVLNVAETTVYLAGVNMMDYIHVDDNLVINLLQNETEEGLSFSSSLTSEREDARQTNVAVSSSRSSEVEETLSNEPQGIETESYSTAIPTKDMAMQAYQVLATYLGSQEKTEDLLKNLYTVGKYLIKEESQDV